MKLTRNTKIALGAAALLGVVWYATSRKKCPAGQFWVPSTKSPNGGWCSKGPGVVEDAGTEDYSSATGASGSGFVASLEGYASNLGSSFSSAFAGLFGSAPTSNPVGSGPITSPDDPRLES